MKDKACEQEFIGERGGEGGGNGRREEIGGLTLGPAGPSLTPQTAEPNTKQCEQRQVCRSLDDIRVSSTGQCPCERL